MASGGVGALLVLSLSALVACEQCKPNTFTPCKAQCNGTTFDLSAAFDFPLDIAGFNFPYIWSPCAGVNCTSSGQTPQLDCAVCQTTYDYNCGRMSNPVWMLESEETQGNKFPNWHIEYTFGDTWRISFFDFVIDETQIEPVVKFVGEVPHLQYNFHVIGKCLGQLTPECKKVYEKRHRRLEHGDLNGD